MDTIPQLQTDIYIVEDIIEELVQQPTVLDILDDYIKSVILNREGQYNDYLNISKIQQQRGIATDVSEMGSGKTRVVIAHVLKEMYTNSNLENILIITSKSVIASWPKNANEVYENMQTYGIGGMMKVLQDDNWVMDDIPGKYPNDPFGIIETMRKLSYAINIISAGDSVSLTNVPLLENKNFNVIFATNHSIPDIGFAYIPTIDEIVHMLVSGKYIINTYNIQLALYQGYKNKDDNELQSEIYYTAIQRGGNPNEGLKLLGTGFNLNSVISPDLSRFHIGDEFVRGSKTKTIASKLTKPNTTYVILDEFHHVLTYSELSIYTLYFVNYMNNIGSKVINLSGTPFDDYRYFTNYLSANGLFTPNCGLTYRYKESNSNRFTVNYCENGINKMINYMYDILDPRGDINGGVLRKYYGIELNQMDIETIIGLANYMHGLIGQKETPIATLEIEFYYLFYMKKAINSSIIVKNPESHFSRKRSINRIWIERLFTDKQFEDDLKALKPNDVYGGGSGGAVTNVERGLEINMIPDIAFRVIDILTRGEQRVKELGRKAQNQTLNEEERVYKGNRVILYMKYIQNIIFVRRTIKALSQFYLDEELSDEDFIIFHKTKEASEKGAKTKDVIESSRAGTKKVIIISLRTGSEGLSLNEDIAEGQTYEAHISHMLVVESFSFLLISQAMSRMIRSGIKRDVVIDIYINHESLGRRMMVKHYHIAAPKIQPEIMVTYGLFEKDGRYLATMKPDEAIEFTGIKGGDSYVQNIHTMFKQMSIQSQGDKFTTEFGFQNTWQVFGIQADQPMLKESILLDTVLFTGDMTGSLMSLVSFYTQFYFATRKSKYDKKTRTSKMDEITQNMEFIMMEYYNSIKPQQQSIEFTPTFT